MGLHSKYKQPMNALITQKGKHSVCLHVGTAFEFIGTTQIHKVILISNCHIAR